MPSNKQIEIIKMRDKKVPYKKIGKSLGIKPEKVKEVYDRLKKRYPEMTCCKKTIEIETVFFDKKDRERHEKLSTACLKHLNFRAFDKYRSSVKIKTTN